MIAKQLQKQSSPLLGWFRFLGGMGKGSTKKTCSPSLPIKIYDSLTGKRKQETSEIRVAPKHWNPNNLRVAPSQPNGTRFNKQIVGIPEGHGYEAGKLHTHFFEWPFGPPKLIDLTN